MTDEDRDDLVMRQRQMAGNLRQRHPEWMIMYGTYTRMFWAFPLFTSVPGRYFGSPDPADLDRRMTEQETTLSSGR